MSISEDDLERAERLSLTETDDEPREPDMNDRGQDYEYLDDTAAENQAKHLSDKGTDALLRAVKAYPDTTALDDKEDRQ